MCEKAGVLDQFPPEWDQEIDLLIKKLDLQLPPDEQKMPLGQREQPLKKAELKHIRRILQKIEKLDAPDKQVRPLILTPEPTEPEAKVKELEEALHRDFDGVVLGTEVLPDPPIRGPYGQAYIPLKEGAIPYRTRPFCMQGERLEAHKK